MYDVNVSRVRCFPAISSGSSRRLGIYCGPRVTSSHSKAAPLPVGPLGLFSYKTVAVVGGEPQWVELRCPAASYEKHLELKNSALNCTEYVHCLVCRREELLNTDCAYFTSDAGVRKYLMFVDLCIIVQFIKKNPTRCNNVSKLYYSIFT